MRRWHKSLLPLSYQLYRLHCIIVFDALFQSQQWKYFIQIQQYFEYIAYMEKKNRLHTDTGNNGAAVTEDHQLLYVNPAVITK